MTDAPMTVFMLVRATPAWLALTPNDRFAFFAREIVPRIAAHPQVRMRFYDSEFYNARVSDVLAWEVADRHAYELVVEGLRETAWWGGYFEVVEILPAVENAALVNYGRDPTSMGVGAAAAAPAD